MNERIRNLIDYINMKIDLASDLGTKGIDRDDYIVIRELINALEIMTNKKYTVKNFKVVEVIV